MGERVQHAARLFFFQAEDGIRDLTVTGVQTCALPIFGRGAGSAPCGTTNVLPAPTAPSRAAAAREWTITARAGATRPRFMSSPASVKARTIDAGSSDQSDRRSEERRVGKAGRTRGTA